MNYCKRCGSHSLLGDGPRAKCAACGWSIATPSEKQRLKAKQDADKHLRRLRHRAKRPLFNIGK